MLKKLSLSILVLGLAAGFAQEGTKKKTDAKPATSKFDLVEGKKIYDMNCSSCHGATGKGDGVASAALKPKPRDLSDAKYIKTRSWEDLHKVIADGGANSGFSALMPAWKGALKKPQLDNVLAYVVSLSGVNLEPAAKAAPAKKKASE
jgi:mono/diheme cytochrome c family protein